MYQTLLNVNRHSEKSKTKCLGILLAAAMLAILYSVVRRHRARHLAAVVRVRQSAAAANQKQYAVRWVQPGRADLLVPLEHLEQMECLAPWVHLVQTA